jgi:hypothetical protein
VILDPDYGERLREVPSGQPTWITMSPVNEPVIRSLWALRSDSSQLTGITGFSYQKDASPADRFLQELDTIDLHHGPYSSDAPYTELEVVGAQLTPSVRSALAKIGFSEFRNTPSGFIALRSDEEAITRRD